MLNEQKGNMYPWVTHTWNVVKGKCPHDCIYCYMKRYPQKELRFDESELKTDLGTGNFIFVGSSCDMWADAVPFEWRILIVRNCYGYPENKYLFQTKNPQRFSEIDWDDVDKFDVMLGCTIETNRDVLLVSKAPRPLFRYQGMLHVHQPKMVSIEPIMEFDLDVLVRWIKDINPEFVSIGADSQGHKLPEPPREKLEALISGLTGITTVKLKSNLSRLMFRR